MTILPDLSFREGQKANWKAEWSMDVVYEGDAITETSGAMLRAVTECKM